MLKRPKKQNSLSIAVIGINCSEQYQIGYVIYLTGRGSNRSGKILPIKNIKIVDDFNFTNTKSKGNNWAR